MNSRGIASFAPPPAEERAKGERIATDIIQLIGWTPLVELNRVAEKDGVEARLVAKLEMYQPLSSIKDRAALRMMVDAEEKGLIEPGKTTLVEPTSGNLGIAMAAIAARRGYKFIAVMPDYYSIERRIILKSLGADVVLSDSKLGIEGMYDKVNQLRLGASHGHTLDQLINPSNIDAHFLTTGPEIWEDTAGKVEVFVCGSGSGGTVSGVGKFLKSKNPAIKIICVEPAESPVISGGSAGPHEIQGMGPGFIPQNLELGNIDEVITVTSAEAMAQARRLATDEGLLVGISSGANLAAALKIAKREEMRGKMIVTVFASGGERYLSTGLFSQIREECLQMKP
ncbi:bifunctional cystathionine gamma-lyase/cysteine synthase-like [Wolffia australiana]